METQKLVYQCPHCGSYELTVCELREVWYDCEPHFEVKYNNIAPCYVLGDTKSGWGDGEYHSTLKYACAKCHHEWLNTAEMHTDGALTKENGNDDDSVRKLTSEEFNAVWCRAYAVMTDDDCIYEIIQDYDAGDGKIYTALIEPNAPHLEVAYLIPRHVEEGAVEFNPKTQRYYFLEQTDCEFIPKFTLLAAIAPK